MNGSILRIRRANNRMMKRSDEVMNTHDPRTRKSDGPSARRLGGSTSELSGELNLMARLPDAIASRRDGTSARQANTCQRTARRPDGPRARRTNAYRDCATTRVFWISSIHIHTTVLTHHATRHAERTAHASQFFQQPTRTPRQHVFTKRSVPKCTLLACLPP